MRLWTARLFLNEGGRRGWSILGAADWEEPGMSGVESAPHTQFNPALPSDSPKKRRFCSRMKPSLERNVERETPGHKRMGHGSNPLTEKY